MPDSQPITGEALQALPRRARVHFVAWSLRTAGRVLRSDRRHLPTLGRLVELVIRSGAGEPAAVDWEQVFRRAQREVVNSGPPVAPPRPGELLARDQVIAGAVRMHIRAATLSAAELIRDPVSGNAHLLLRHCQGAVRTAGASDLEDQIHAAFEHLQRQAAADKWTDATPIPAGFLPEP